MLIEFCLPVYNEEKILKANTLYLLDFCRKQLFDFDWKIILVINGSTDNSAAIGEELAENSNGKINCFIVKEPGRGRALKKYWSLSQAGIAAYMDIDLAASLNNIPGLINSIKSGTTDVAIGSRLMAESSITRSFIRELSSQTYNFLSRIILGHKFSDLQCGFKAVRIETFKKISPFIKNDKWFFDTEMIAYAHRLGYKVAEIPVNWSENRYDKRKSKVNLLKDSLIFLVNLIKLRVVLGKIKKTKDI